jgi:predicted nucleotidyltransferase
MGNNIPNMGKRPAAQGLGTALFPRVRLRVLSVLFGEPERAFSISEIIRMAASGNGAVARELDRLRAANLITVRGKLYQVNRHSPIFNELRMMLLKTIGLVEPLRSALKPLESKIDFAFIFGSVAKGLDTATSDIDLMIVSDDVAYGEVFKAVQKAEKQLRRTVSPQMLTAEEWRQKRKEKGSFVSKIADQPRLFVFGSDDDRERAR